MAYGIGRNRGDRNVGADQPVVAERPGKVVGGNQTVGVDDGPVPEVPCDAAEAHDGQLSPRSSPWEPAA
jgi:hypothetical protein